jgi:hypothetical protein
MPRRAVKRPAAATATDLRAVSLLTPQTRQLHMKALDAFAVWLQRNGVKVDVPVLILCPLAIDALVESYVASLYADSAPLYVYPMTVTGLQNLAPSLKKVLHKSWKLASTWSALEPAEHRRPLPVALFRALVVASFVAGWGRFAAASMIAFLGPARIGEVLRSCRSSLVLPCDVLFDPADKLYLQVIAPKSRFRGGSATQHVSVTGLAEVAFIAHILGALPGDAKLYTLSDGAFRKRWDVLLHRLGVPAELGFTPASLRAGGTVFAYNAGVSINDLMWRLRLQNLRTLNHYLQEVATATSLRTVQPACRENIAAAAALYYPLMRATSHAVQVNPAIAH